MKTLRLGRLQDGMPEFLDSGAKSWTLDSELWTLDCGRWTLKSGRFKTLKFKIV